MAKPRLGSLGEFGWLKKLLPRLYWPKARNPQLWIGPGDDAGVLGITPNKGLVATTDAMVEGVHFDRRWFPWEDLGFKILAINLSDLAAMGRVKPIAALVTAAFPGDTPVESVDKFYRGLESCARRWKIGLLGGDTVGSRRDWMLSVTALGEAGRRDLIRRDTAQPGDLLVASGPLGLAAAGLEVLQRGRAASWTAPLVRAFSRPEPRFAIAAQLAQNRWATALMDCSDGLEASARLLAEGAGLGVEIDGRGLKPTGALARWAALRRRPVSDYLLRGGEEYELVFTLRPRDWPSVRRRVPEAQVVGRMLGRREKHWLLADGRRLPLQSYGFSHFKV
jgi:thiamine-monophosphate kinase